MKRPPKVDPSAFDPERFIDAARADVRKAAAPATVSEAAAPAAVRKTSLNLPEDLYRRVRIAAAQEGRPIGAVVGEALERWLKGRTT